MARRTLRATSLAALAAVTFSGFAARAVLFPTVDRPDHVDGIVVVAGADDDRYVFARSLAESGTSERILISRPGATSLPYAHTLDTLCSQSPIHARDGRSISVECFAPDSDTTEGEAAAATAIARRQGWETLLVVTYWGHVTRVRLYFEQCFDGQVSVTDTPRPLSKSRADALLHETGGYIKAALIPAC